MLRIARTVAAVAGVLVASLAVSSITYADVEQKETAAFVLCKNKKDVRTIRVLKGSQKAENCMTTYSKGQVEEVVGQNRSLSGCRSILKSIQSNLENAQWSCRSVEMARVMVSSEITR